MINKPLLFGNDIVEREANYFAMCMLMPKEFLLKDIEAMGGFDIEDEKSIKKLAVKYKVSVPVMTLRIGQIL